MHRSADTKSKGDVQEMAALFLAHSPSFLRKEVPRRGGGWLPLWAQKECEIRFSRFVIPSAAEGSFSFPVSVFLRKAVCMRRRTPKSHEACFPFSALLTASPDRERKRFLAFARNDDAGKGFAIGKAAFSLLPLEGGASKGRGWLCEPVPAGSHPVTDHS